MKNTIVVSEDGMFASNPIQLDELVNIFCAAITGAVTQMKEQYKDDPDAKKIDKEIFDGMNSAFGLMLEACFPDLELHPEMTEQVMKEVLNKETEKVTNMAKHRKKR